MLNKLNVLQVQVIVHYTYIYMYVYTVYYGLVLWISNFCLISDVNTAREPSVWHLDTAECRKC